MSIFPSLWAQVVSYSVKPGEYSSIEPCWEDMYYVTKENNVGVIRGDGKVVVEPTASHITGFYEDLALVLKSESGQHRLLGILSPDGSYKKVDGDYYSIPYQEFFSEGLLTVSTPRGNVAFMNPLGVVVKEFNARLLYPFAEGFAVLGEGSDYSLIDKHFNRVSIKLPTNAPIMGGTNVFEGKAVIWADNGKYYSYDLFNGKTKKISAPKSGNLDYLACFADITNRAFDAPYQEPRRGTKSLSASSKNGKFGYMSGEETVIPYQFDQAEDFYDGHAIVKNDGKYALLSYQPERGNFEVIAKNPEIKFRKSSGNRLTHRFDLKLPDNIKKDAVTISLKNEDGYDIDYKYINGSYQFLSDADSESKKYDVAIESDGLKLWEGELEYTYQQDSKPDPVPVPPSTNPQVLSKLSVSLSATRTHANKDNLCSVTATITNPNPTPVKTNVRWSGSSLLVGSGTAVTVPARGKISVVINLKVLKAKSGETVTVTTSAGGSATLRGLQLIPY